MPLSPGRWISVSTTSGLDWTISGAALSTSAKTPAQRNPSTSSIQLLSIPRTDASSSITAMVIAGGELELGAGVSVFTVVGWRVEGGGKTRCVIGGRSRRRMIESLSGDTDDERNARASALLADDLAAS